MRLNVGQASDRVVTYFQNLFIFNFYLLAFAEKDLILFFKTRFETYFRFDLKNI